MGCPAGTVVPYAGFVLPNGWLWANGSAVSRTMFWALWAALGAESTVTIAIASPGVVTWTGHGLSNDWPVKFSTTGALPTGLVAGTTYFVVSATANTFEVAATPGGAAINTSGSQSGTQTGIFAPYGDGDGSTTFNVPDLRGRVAFGLDNLGGASPAGRVTAAGSGIDGTSPAASGGEQSVTLTTSQIPVHSHGVNDPGHAHTQPIGQTTPATFTGRAAYGDGNSLSNPSVNTAFTGITIQNAGSGGAHNNMPPTLMTNYIIKYC